MSLVSSAGPAFNAYSYHINAAESRGAATAFTAAGELEQAGQYESLADRQENVAAASLKNVIAVNVGGVVAFGITCMIRRRKLGKAV